MAQKKNDYQFTNKSLRTLCIDIGGSWIKAMILDEEGNPASTHFATHTPKSATPDAVTKIIWTLARTLGQFDRVSVGFPGVVRHGVVFTTVNLDSQWQKFDLTSAIEQKLDKPVCVSNDADIQGLGAIVGKGLELVLTLGTGFGTALFLHGNLMPNLEIAHHPFYIDHTYEQCLGKAALKRNGKTQWNNHLKKAIVLLENTFNYDNLHIGGGHTAFIDLELPANARIVPNVTGILGGIALWHRASISNLEV